MTALPHSSWLAPVLAVALSATALWLLARGRGLLPQDHPTGRSLHGRPVTRVGGLAIWAGFLPVALLYPSPIPGGAIWLVAWASVTAVSVADDWIGVRPLVRLAVHALAALAVAAALLRQDAANGPELPQALAIAGTAVALVWSANLFNFMDGNDGLAAVMAICGFGAFGVATARAGIRADALFALVAATSVFLVVNLPPARTFMGDGGSVGLGFLAAVFGCSGIRVGIWPSGMRIELGIRQISNSWGSRTSTMIGAVPLSMRPFNSSGVISTASSLLAAVTAAGGVMPQNWS